MMGDEAGFMEKLLLRIMMSLSFVCSSKMATDKSALNLSTGCSTADVALSCLYPGEKEEMLLN